MDDIVNEIKEIISSIKNKQLDKAESEVNFLIEETEKKIKSNHEYDFDDIMQFYFYCQSNGKENIKWTQTHISDLYMYKGIIYFDKGDFAKAIKYQNEALKYNPVKIKSYHEILEAYINLKDEKGFLKAFKEAMSIALEPYDISVLYKRYAFILIDMKQYEKAYNILRYTNLIFSREENMREIGYLSSLAKVKLYTSPDVGMIDYIKENELEYTCNPAVIMAYYQLAETAYSCTSEREKTRKSTLEEQVKDAEGLVNIYSKLYFFEGSEASHNMLITAQQEYSKKLEAQKAAAQGGNADIPANPQS